MFQLNSSILNYISTSELSFPYPIKLGPRDIQHTSGPGSLKQKKYQKRNKKQEKGVLKIYSPDNTKRGVGAAEVATAPATQRSPHHPPHSAGSSPAITPAASKPLACSAQESPLLDKTPPRTWIAHHWSPSYPSGSRVTQPPPTTCGQYQNCRLGAIQVS